MGQTTASLFVAYMLVLQSLAVGLVATPVLRGGMFAATVCVNDEVRAPDGAPATPGPTGGHAKDQCCVFHCSGAGAPLASAPAVVPAPVYGVLAHWSGPTKRALSRWPTLPVGSRAPPTILL
jgi:hypothetical protein